MDKESVRRWPTEKVVDMIIEKFGEEVAEKFRGSYILASYLSPVYKWYLTQVSCVQMVLDTQVSCVQITGHKCPVYNVLDISARPIRG